ncbi:MAG TPA: helix-turn-helix domain-containing protein [Candidatus Micrarchaeaceae archaeon]|nr:helix-turn-helix domain-containing protein [Candidatus Micrarchaeaceae archaeon]
MPRSYQLGRRQAAVDGTRLAILAAARELVASGEAGVTPGAVARRAGVSRITVYNRFGSKAGLLRELATEAHSRPAGEASGPSDPRHELRKRIADACWRWASDPALFRRLPLVVDFQHDSPPGDWALAERLAAAGLLRPGCSLKEAEDVIGAITSFTVFDRLHKDGRRSQAAVVEILWRLAATLLNSEPALHSA